MADHGDRAEDDIDRGGGGEPRHLTRFGWPDTGWREPALPLQGEPDLALGERRAKAVRNFLLLEGVASNQIEVVSYGEERAENPEHSEEAWSQNRRVEILYLN